MLETTLSTSFSPGTNIKGQVAGANWSFLLPCLELDRTVCIGAPPLTTLTTLSRLNREVIVTCRNARQAQAVHALGQKNNLANVHTTSSRDHLAVSSSSSADLVLIVGWRNTRRFSRNRALMADIQRLLKPEGLIYFESTWLSSDQVGDGRNHDPGSSQLLWLTPLTGEMQTAVPLQDVNIIDYFLRHRLYTPSANVPILDKVERFLNSHAFFGRFSRRYGALVGQELDSQQQRRPHQPPRYLRQIARAANVDIDHHRWALSARGRYNSRKVLFFLFEEASSSPEYIVKITRDSAFNARLENEYHALTLLRQKGLGGPETLPQPLFLDCHGGLAIVGETVIDGVPFRRRTTGTADDPYGRVAIEWLTDLSIATADSTIATTSKVAEELWQLFVRFLETYCLTLEQTVFLAEQIDIIRRHLGTFPLVFQHGDPGTWNLMVTSGGEVAFLDWEAAEPHGMPLWDLFYFLRSYCTWAARKQGTRDSLKGFAQHFLAESSLTPLLIKAIRRYSRQIGLPPRLIEPLFYTCWMHRALKQATRLSPARLEKGHYVNLLRLCIDRRNTPELDRLFQTYKSAFGDGGSD